jgi:hypothetical protein
MPSCPSFTAYAIHSRPGQNPRRLAIGVAWPRLHGGLTVLLDALPVGFDGRIALLAPRATPTSRARFFPAEPPAILNRPAYRAERQVWQALRRAALPAGTLVFYNRATTGCRRRADFLILLADRGVIAVEVKGGRLIYRGGFRQPLAGRPWTKRIEPWLQSHRALTQIFAALGINPLSVPQARMAAMPGTRAGELPFPSGPHLLTAEELEPRQLARKLEALLPRLDPVAGAALGPTLDTLAEALTRTSDRTHQ